MGIEQYREGLRFNLAILDTIDKVALLKGSLNALKKVLEISNKNDSVAITIITAYVLLNGAYLLSKYQENPMIAKEQFRTSKFSLRIFLFR